MPCDANTLTDPMATVSTSPATSRPQHAQAVSAPAGELAPVLELRHIGVDFQRSISAHSVSAWLRGRSTSARPQPVRAVDDVSLSVGHGEIVGLVGESGCGKSTLSRVAVGLQPATRGERLLHGRPLAAGCQRNPREQLAMQMVFQDPSACLNPRLRVETLVGEAAVTHGLIGRREQRDHVAQLLESVGLRADMASRFPHQFSGGQRARIGIARALAVRPEFIVCDESVAALDVSVQSQVLNLFMSLRERLGLSYLFVSHNLAVVHHMADRVVVMYLGRVVESLPADGLFERAMHPYTRALLAEVPTLQARKRKFVAIEGDIPSPLSPPGGCHFHPRCPHAMPRCAQVVPLTREVGARHQLACHLLDA